MFKLENLQHFIEKDLKGQKCEIVTADGGGIESSSGDQYEMQELYNVKLFYTEAITCLACQKLGGAFILKIYEIFYDLTIQILFLLSQHYKSVKIIKPHNSRPASSERYIICQDFNGITNDQLKSLFEGLEA